MVDVHRLWVLKEKLNKLFLSMATIELLSEINEFRIEPLHKDISGTKSVIGLCVLFETKNDPYDRKIALQGAIKDAMEDVIKTLGPVIVDEALKRVKANSKELIHNLLIRVREETEAVEKEVPFDIKELMKKS